MIEIYATGLRDEADQGRPPRLVGMRAEGIHVGGIEQNTRDVAATDGDDRRISLYEKTVRISQRLDVRYTRPYVCQEFGTQDEYGFAR